MNSPFSLPLYPLLEILDFMHTCKCGSCWNCLIYAHDHGTLDAGEAAVDVAGSGDLDKLKWVCSAYRGSPHLERATCAPFLRVQCAAAMNGQFDCMVFAIENSCKWSLSDIRLEFIYQAISQRRKSLQPGYLKCEQYAREHGFWSIVL